MKRVLITGSSGFIGSKLKLKLLQKGHEIIEIHEDNSDISDIETLNSFDLHSVSHIFHLAGKTFVPESWEHPSSFYNVNTKGTMNVLELCRTSGARLTFISTYIYGEPDHLPISESDRLQPNNPYAHSKYLAEQLCEFYSRNFGVQVCVLRPFNVFGIGQDERFLIPTIIKQAFFNEQFSVKDLTPKRDYIYIDDLIEAILLTEKVNKRYSVFNIGSGYSISVKEIIDIVQNIMLINKPVSSEACIRKNEINNVIANITAANSHLSWLPKYTVEDGLREIIDYERRTVYGTTKYSD